MFEIIQIILWTSLAGTALSLLLLPMLVIIYGIAKVVGLLS
jgi:hypothetical protein